jgi:hypothetical protein
VSVGGMAGEYDTDCLVTWASVRDVRLTRVCLSIRRASVLRSCVWLAVWAGLCGCMSYPCGCAAGLICLAVRVCGGRSVWRSYVGRLSQAVCGRRYGVWL